MLYTITFTFLLDSTIFDGVPSGDDQGIRMRIDDFLQDVCLLHLLM